jgi:PKD repeat protein
MKKITIIIVILFSLTKLNAQQIWSAPIQIDSVTGKFPTLSYAPNGDIRVFYYNEDTYEMIVRKREQNDTIFGSEIFVYDGAKNAGVHYAEGDTIDMAVAAGDLIYVLRSTDNGNTWTVKRSYTASNNIGSPCYLPLYFTEEDTTLRLIYGYIYYNAVFGNKPQFYQAVRNSGNWEIQTFIDGGEIKGVYENDTNVSIVSNKGIYFSTDNGENYTLLGDSGPIPEMLNARDMVIGDNNRIYILRNFTYGLIGEDKNLTFTYSDDNGATWLTPQIQIINGGEYMFYPRFAIDGNRIVVVWLDTQTSFGQLGYENILYTISEDSGQNWSPVDTVFATSGTDIIPEYIGNGVGMLDIKNYNGKVTLAYFVLDDFEKHVYIREIIYENVPVADFSALNTQGCDTLTVFFQNNSSNGNFYYWNFGDSNISFLENPVHFYDTAGIYTVSLTVIDTITGLDSIIVLDSLINIHTSPFVYLGNDTTICINDIIILDAGSDFTSYLWNDSTTNQTLTVDTTGTYYVTVADSNGCTVSDTINITIDVCPYIEIGFSQVTIKLYPNPAQNILNLEIENNTKEQVLIEIISLAGKIVYSEYFKDIQNKTIKQIDITDKTKGIYFVKVQSKKDMKVGKIIIQ